MPLLPLMKRKTTRTNHSIECTGSDFKVAKTAFRLLFTQTDTAINYTQISNWLWDLFGNDLLSLCLKVGEGFSTIRKGVCGSIRNNKLNASAFSKGTA